MSIKKLFDSTKNNNYLSDATEKTAFQDVESERNFVALKEKESSYTPQINYAQPREFAKYGSAYYYYEGAMDRITDYYPYDGSDAEINEFLNGCNNVEDYILDNLYPRTNGYINLSVGGWGTLNGSVTSDGYGLPSTLEYILFKGGPHALSNSDSLVTQTPTSYNNKYQYANVYDTSIYTTAGLPSNYGSGSRESNLQSDFAQGVTVEFWLKKPAFTNASSSKEVVLDVWTSGSLSSSADYGRITIELTGAASGSPFRITAQSGTSGVFLQSIGQNLTATSLQSWGHYAIVLQNTGSDLKSQLYVNGTLNHSQVHSAAALNELKQKQLIASLGSLVATPSGSSALAGAGKLSASVDEFRFWKVARNGQQIGRHWFTQVRGGSNTDISNTTLGIYFKFNEGITGTSSVDSVVLDYSGRISNGAWTGYGSNSRNTGSAIVSASAAATEYRDPIIRSTHSELTNLRTGLLNSGSYHDSTNNSMFLYYLPTWVIEDHEKNDNTNLAVLSHILGSYFDQLYLLTQQVPKLKHANYTSSSYSPAPFARHMPQSLGLFTPDIFVDANVMEKFLNRDDTTLFQNDLSDTKNLIYLNLYNNLSNIFKAKGTEKAIRNVLRCFYLDEKVVNFNIYSNRETYTLADNYEQFSERRNYLNFNTVENRDAVVYQAIDASNADSSGFISGSQANEYEDHYGATIEAEIMLPTWSPEYDDFNRRYTNVSLFGQATVNTSSVASLSGTTTTFITEDVANFQVLAVKEDINSRNVYFKLTSSYSPYPFPILTSSTFFGAYDNTKWNFSVRVKPSNYPLPQVNGADNSNLTYDLIFQGRNNIAGTTTQTFSLTSSLSKGVGENFLRAAKRLYVGAQRTNLTGALINNSDVQVSAVRYWAKYLEDGALAQHTYDVDNHGISGSYRNISPFDGDNNNLDILNLHTLALNWKFSDLNTSDGSGNFVVTDFSSGSALLRDNYGWMGKIFGYQHSGYGYGFEASSTEIVDKKLINVLKITDPERASSAEMVQILSEDDRVFGVVEAVPDYVFTVEKSMYRAVSEEMLDFFAGVVDFNNTIGAPVNRYRGRYKDLEKLREIFFQRVTQVSNIEKYLTYYKWFDDGILSILEQFIPASAKFVKGAYNVVESHVLERAKYETKFPTLEFKPQDPEAKLEGGITEKLYPYKFGSSPTSGSGWSSPTLRKTDVHQKFWHDRAERDAPEITSGNGNIDGARTTYRNVATTNPRLKVNAPTLQTPGGTRYSIDTFANRNFGKLFSVDWKLMRRTLKGGVNFEAPKSLSFTYNALYPFGPINTDGGVFVPRNVLLGLTTDLVGLEDNIDDLELRQIKDKTKRHIKVHHGRDWEQGFSYSNTDSDFSFPFNIMSSSVKSGFNKEVVERVTASITITNLHNDGYGPDIEVPMQTTFTEYAVGGHQSRHVKLNTGADTPSTRPEAWKILVGRCPGTSGALGMVSPDYPLPDAAGTTALEIMNYDAPRAIYYRDLTVKSPVNIKNIQMRTGSTILGNYQKNYEVVSTVGAYANPRSFVENQPKLPSIILGNSNLLTGTNVIGNYLTLNSNQSLLNDPDHTNFYNLDYMVTDFSGAHPNNSVIVSRFGAPGGRTTMARGRQDFRSSEFSPYNTLNYRNLPVLNAGVNTGSAQTGSTNGAGSGIRAYDVNGQPFGLNQLLSRHAAKFGRDSLFPLTPYSLNKSFYPNNDDGLSDRQRYVYEQDYEYTSHADLQMWLKMDKDVSSAGDIPDDSGNSKVGGFPASNDRPTFVPETPSPHIQSNCCDFNGSTNQVKIGTAAVWEAIIGSGGTSKMTLAVWVNLDTHDGGVENFMDFGGDNILFGRQAANKVYFQTEWNSGAAAWWLSTILLDDYEGTWIHVAVSYDAGSTANNPVIYVNGEAITLSGPLGTAPAGSWDGITVSACFLGGTTNRITGKLADAAIWDSVLTAAEIKAIYKATNGIYASTRASEIAPGASYDQAPAFHQPNRNAKTVMKLVGENNYRTSSAYDNFWVQHQIPRSDSQYHWITSSVLNLNSHFGYLPANYQVRRMVNGVATYIDGYNFVSASNFGSYVTAGTRKWGDSFNVKGGDGFVPVDILGLNFNIVEGASGSTNTIGNGSDALSLSVNSDFIGAIDGTMTGSIFNSLMLHRNGPWQAATWKRNRAADDSPIIRYEKQTNKLSMITGSDPDTGIYQLARFDLRPVSLRGRPTLVNYDDGNRNITIKATSNNEKIFFQGPRQNDINELQDFDAAAITTPLDQMLLITNASTNYNLNWVLYTENIFPSERNEMASASTQRINYDNKFWRGTPTARGLVGSQFRNSFMGGPAFTSAGPWVTDNQVSQSCWPLDTTLDFVTRTTLSGSTPGGNYYTYWTGSGGGELQNHYNMRYLMSPTVFAAGAKPKVYYMQPSALYARKQTLQIPTSVVSPTGIPIPETSSVGGHPTYDTVGSRIQKDPLQADWDLGSTLSSSDFGPGSRGNFAGDTYWDAPSQAGIMVKTGSTYVFKSDPSEPWFSDYDDFQHDLKLMAKDYAVVPEFRMSTHIDDYTKFGINASDKYDTFEIPGTKETSATSSFYLDYSNSEFLKDFLKIQLDSGKTPTQIRLSCKAAVRFNPYRGFYPAQRTLEMTSMFSSSYIKAMVARYYSSFDSASYNVGPEAIGGMTKYPGLYNAILRPLFAPGILYNSIKAGMAVDYPVVHTPERVYGGAMTKFGLAGTAEAGASGSDAWYQADRALNKNQTIWAKGTGDVRATAQWENYLVNIDTRSQPSGAAGCPEGADQITPYYKNGSIFDERFPFEAIVAPEQYIAGRQLTSIEPHPSASMGVVTASLLPIPSDGMYTAFAQNFFGQVAEFFLENRDYTGLKSKAMGTNLQFESGSIYMTRIRLRRSMNGKRRYDQESGSLYISSSINAGGGTGFGKVTGSNNHYGLYGAQAERYLLDNAGIYGVYHWPMHISGAFYPLPQDPRNDSAIQETFTLYSRPGAFGPPMAGYELGSPPSYGFTASVGGWTGKAQEILVGGGFGAINTGSATYETVEGETTITAVSGWSVRKDRSLFSPMDSANGFYWAHTPPYYNGEAWCDVIFRPNHTRSYDVEEILAQSEKVYWRCDAGYRQLYGNVSIYGIQHNQGYRLINSGALVAWGRGAADHRGGVGSGDSPLYRFFMTSSTFTDRDCDTINAPYGGANINDNAMQVSASIDLFGIEEVPTVTVPLLNPGLDDLELTTNVAPGAHITQQNVSVGSRWVIKPKFETPHMNFSTEHGPRPVTASTMPNTFGRGSVSYGMWHQYGLPETDPTRGIFLDIDDIPQEWLKNHHDVVLTPDTAYNKHIASPKDLTDGQTPSSTDRAWSNWITSSSTLWENVKSLKGVFGFESENSQARLGQLAQSRTIKEAVVAVPYVLDAQTDQRSGPSNAFRQNAMQLKKKWIDIPTERYQAAISATDGTSAGDSLDAAGESIRRLVEKMPNYILPPQFDFLNNPDVDPIVMYMFEFEYRLDKDDLSYIWQNLAPRDYKKITFEESSEAHELMDTELLSADNILNNPNLRWMVFKVKQRAKIKYSDLKVPQVGSYSSLLSAGLTSPSGYPLQYNWPYDFVSFVELIKMDAEVLYTDPIPEETTDTATPTQPEVFQSTAQQTAVRQAAVYLPTNQVQQASPQVTSMPRVQQTSVTSQTNTQASGPAQTTIPRTRGRGRNRGGGGRGGSGGY